MSTDQVAPQVRLLPIREVCRRYSVSDRTVDRWLRIGALPEPVRINTYRYWRESDLEAFERKNVKAKGHNPGWIKKKPPLTVEG
jgi:predicted DNA-binding transcriptional regulator AlpA